MESQALLTTLVSRRLNGDILGAVLRAFRLEVWCLAPWNTVLSTGDKYMPEHVLVRVILLRLSYSILRLRAVF